MFNLVYCLGQVILVLSSKVIAKYSDRSVQTGYIMALSFASLPELS